MLPSSLALPGPIRALDSKTMLTLTRGIPPLCHARLLQISPVFHAVALSEIMPMVGVAGQASRAQSDRERLTSALVPPARAKDNPHHGEHDRHFDEHADDSREGRTRLEAEEGDRRRDSELEEIRRSDQCRRAGHTMWDSERPVERIGDRGIEIDLNHDGDRKQRDDQWLSDDLLA